MKGGILPDEIGEIVGRSRRNNATKPAILSSLQRQAAR